MSTRSLLAAALAGALGGALLAGCGPLDLPGPATTKTQSEQWEFTPTEVSVEATPQADGSLRVAENVVFDAGADGGSDPLVWVIGGVRIGWYGENGERRTGQYWVDPKVSEVTAESDGQDLSVTVDDSAVDGTSTGYHRYELAPAQPWAPDRHRVTISYVLTDVYVQLNGVPTMVLPLEFPATYGRDSTYYGLTVDGEPPLWCLADNVDAGTHQPCNDAESGSLSWIGQYDQSIEAVGIRNPTGVEASPAEPLRRT